MAKFNGAQNIIPLNRPKSNIEKLATWILVLNGIQLALIIAILLAK